MLDGHHSPIHTRACETLVSVPYVRRSPPMPRRSPPHASPTRFCYVLTIACAFLIGSAVCEPISCPIGKRFRTAAEAEVAPNILLFSFEGSGNTWTRSLIEQATGTVFPGIVLIRARAIPPRIPNGGGRWRAQASLRVRFTLIGP